MENFKSSIWSIVFFAMVSYDGFCQEISKRILVEHFTNTRCSVCAARNPGFYEAKKQKSDVLHIAYHPSSPYNNCLFSTQNKVENDARTNHYDLYGGTPTFCINGDIKSSSEVQNVAVYNPYENQTSPISIVVEITPAGSDSISVLVEVKAVSAHTLTNLSLYVPVIEDTVFYNAPNGEKQHYDVFRKSFSGPDPVIFNAPVLGGSSFVYMAKMIKNQLWNMNRLSAVAIVSSMDKRVIQVAQSDLYSEEVAFSENDPLNLLTRITLFPNPSFNSLNIHSGSFWNNSNFKIYNVHGIVVKAGLMLHGDLNIDVDQLPPGSYVFQLVKDSATISKMFIKI